MRHKNGPRVYFCTGIKTGFLTRLLLFQLFLFLFSESILLFHDPHFNFKTFQAWKMKL